MARKKTDATPPSGRAGKKSHNPGAFLDLPPAASAYDSAAAVVLPLPFEESVSYGGGTRQGPDAIIAASRQVELYDPRRDVEAAMIYGVHTLPPPACFDKPIPSGKGRREAIEGMMQAIAGEAESHLARDKFVIGLGGEHTVSLGMALAVARVCGPFTLVHIDAHADLRDTYEDDKYSHACVVRRIAEIPECEAVLQLGIRSTSPDQMDFVREHSSRRGAPPVVRTWFARDMNRDKKWKKELRRAVAGRKVFFTFDVDGLDPSIVPATGTPEPDGLSWKQLMCIAKIVAKKAERCVAMDCVELAPVPGLHYADFAAARAVYELASRFLLL